MQVSDERGLSDSALRKWRFRLAPRLVEVDKEVKALGRSCGLWPTARPRAMALAMATCAFSLRDRGWRPGRREIQDAMARREAGIGKSSNQVVIIAMPCSKYWIAMRSVAGERSSQ